MPKVPVAFRIDEILLKAIDQLAQDESRNRTNAIESMLTRFLREHRPELLKPEAGPNSGNPET